MAHVIGAQPQGHVECGVPGRSRRQRHCVRRSQIPPRNVNWFSQGKWVQVAKVAFEKDFFRKMKRGNSEPIYEKYVMAALGITHLKTRVTREAETV